MGNSDENGTGIVIQTDGDYATIRVNAHNSCENCMVCTQDEFLKAENPLNAQAGQRVSFEIRTDHAIWIAFVLFVFPMLALFAGIYLGKILTEKLALRGTWLLIGGGVLAFVLSFLAVFQYEKKSKSKFKKITVVTKILG